VPGVGEGRQTVLGPVLRDGLEQLDLNFEVTFQRYSRVVLPLDKYVFWQPTITERFRGALHFVQDVEQSATETVGFAQVVFTAEQPVAEFSTSPLSLLWVAAYAGVRYAFSQQQVFPQAGLYHYLGHSIYPALASQLLDTPDAVDLTQAVAANSLPLWLALNNYVPIYGSAGGAFTNSTALFPAKLVDANLTPPYGVVDIDPAGTRALQAVPYLDLNRNHYQLAADKVRVTLYGLQNNAVLDFLDCVEQYTLDTNNFGIMNTPVVAVGQREQVELRALAMQSVIDFEVSYYQVRAAQVARRLILNALPVGYILNNSAS